MSGLHPDAPRLALCWVAFGYVLIGLLWVIGAWRKRG